jgi:hypothetical protein
MAESVGNLVIKIRYRGSSGVKIKSIPVDGINSSHKIESVQLVKLVTKEEVVELPADRKHLAVVEIINSDD